ncbi:MAG: transcription antitermination factor NusB [Abditibacteriaceae bacterium]
MPIGKRRGGRELAFQLIFQADVGDIPLDEVISIHKASSEAQPQVWAFAEELANGAWTHLEDSDAIISKYSQGWSVERMPNVDRNILRIALYEIFHMEDIPVNVSVNEAVELAKEYSTVDSARFINGVLGNVVRKEL